MAETREVIVDGKVTKVEAGDGLFIAKISPDGTVESFVDGSADNILYILADGICNFIRNMEEAGVDGEKVLMTLVSVSRAMAAEQGGDTDRAMRILGLVDDEVTRLQ